MGCITGTGLSNNTESFEKLEKSLLTLAPREKDGSLMYILDAMRNFMYGTSYAAELDAKSIFFDFNSTHNGEFQTLFVNTATRLLQAEGMQDLLAEIEASGVMSKGEKAIDFLSTQFLEFTQKGGTMAIRSKYSTKVASVDHLFRFMDQFYSNLEGNISLFTSEVVGSSMLNLSYTSEGAGSTIKGLSTSMHRYLDEGMVLNLFSILSPSELATVVSKGEGHQDILLEKYGQAGSFGTVYNEILEYLKARYVAIDDEFQKLPADHPKAPIMDRELDDLYAIIEDNGVLHREWSNLVNANISYLAKLGLNLNDILHLDEAQDDTAEINSRDALGITAANEVNPASRLSKEVKVILKTLPDVLGWNEVEGNYLFRSTRVGTPKGKSFGTVINALYQSLSNQATATDKFQALIALSRKDPSYEVLLERLGVDPVGGWEATDKSSLSDAQWSIIISFLTAFNNASHTFTITNITPGGQRNTQNANTESDNRNVKYVWKQNFINVTQSSLGHHPDGKHVLNLDAKLSTGISLRKTLEFGGRTAAETLDILAILGIQFTDRIEVLTTLEEDETFYKDFKVNVKRIFDTLVKKEGDIADIFKMDLGGRFEKLIQLELETSVQLSSLQIRSLDGKTKYAASLKGAVDVIADDLNSNGNTRAILQKSSSGVNSIWLNGEERVEIATMIGSVNTETQRSSSVDNLGRGDIAVAEISSILSGRVPFIKTGNKVTHITVKVGDPNFAMNSNEMSARLLGYLEDEIVTAQMIKHGAASKIKGVAERGKNLQFFNHSDFSELFTGTDALILNPNTNRESVKKWLKSNIVKVSEVLDAHIASEIAKVKDVLLKYEIVQKSGKGFTNIGIHNDHVDRIDSHLTTSGQLASGIMASRLFHRIAEQIMFIRTTSMHEQFKVFLGHPAVYSDIFKRTSLFVGPKKYPITDTSILEWENIKFPPLGNTTRYAKHSKDEVRFITRREVTEVSEFKKQYIQTLNALESSEQLKNTVANVYGNSVSVPGKYTHDPGGMEIFDGGGFIHLDFYRRVRRLTDSWTEKEETAYNNVIKGNVTEKDMGLLAPLKPQVIAQALEDGIDIRVGNKFALFPIHPNLSKVVNKEEGEISMIDLLYEDMNKNNLDYVVMESATKLAGKRNSTGQFEEFVDETGAYSPIADESGVQSYDLKYFGIQMDPKDKRGENVSIGTQSIAMLLSNIFKTATVTSPYSNTKFNNKTNETWGQAANRYHRLNTNIIQRETQILAGKLGFIYDSSTNTFEELDEKVSRDLMRDTILDELEGRDMPETMKDSVWRLFEGDMNLLNQVGEKTRLETIIHSIITNSIVKRKMNGNMVVLQSNFGFQVENRAERQTTIAPGLRKLKSYRKDISQEDLDRMSEFDRKTFLKNADTLAMEVYMPHHMRSFFGEDIPEHIEITDEVREALGFRIPTEGLNSIEFIKIVGFLPQRMGGTIIVPSEMVAKSGADFDIDKLTLYLQNTEVVDNKIVPVRGISLESMTVGDATYLRHNDLDAYFSLMLKALPTNVAYERINTIRELTKNKSVVNNFFKAYNNNPTINAYKEEIDKLRAAAKAAPDKLERDKLFAEADAMRERLATRILKDPSGLFGEFQLPNIIEYSAKVQEQLLVFDENLLEYVQVSSTVMEEDLQTSAFQQNKLQTFMRDVLRHPQSFEMLITPVGAYEFKDIAYFIDDIKNPDEWEGGVRTSKKLVSLLSLDNIIDTTYKMYQTLGGTGIVASGITHHIKMQKSKTGFNPDVVKFNFKEFHKDLRLGHTMSADNKATISSYLQQYITAYVDGEKDPFAVYVNAGKNAAAIHMLLLRMGVPLKTTLLFMSQPIITEYLERKDMKQSLSLSADDRFEADDDIVEDLLSTYGGKEFESPRNLSEGTLEELLALTIDSKAPVDKRMSSTHKKYQVQILQDFVRYKEYAEDLRNLQSIHSYDKLKLKDGSENIYLEALEIAVSNLDTFINPMEIIESPNSMLSQGRKSIQASKTLMGKIDLKNTSTNMRQFYVNKAVALIEQGIPKEKILYMLSRFDNYVTAHLLQNVMIGDEIIGDKAASLFQGERSYPRVIKDLQESGEFSNFAIDNFLPLLDPYTKGSRYASVDGIKLKNGKYDSWDIDVLAEAYKDLKFTHPSMHRDGILFSILQSGIDFSPNSFFGILPSEDLMPITNSAFTAFMSRNGAHKDLDNIWDGFITANWGNARVSHIQFLSDYSANRGLFGKDSFDTKNFSWVKGNYLTLMKQSELEYEHAFFIKSKDGLKWNSASKTSLPNKLLEASGRQSIIKSNKYPILDRHTTTVKVIRAIIGGSKQLEGSAKIMLDGNYMLDNQAVVSFKKKYYGTAKSIIKEEKEEGNTITMEDLAIQLGFSDLASAKKSKKYEGFFKNKALFLYELDVQDSGNNEFTSRYEEEQASVKDSSSTVSLSNMKSQSSVC